MDLYTVVDGTENLMFRLL